MNSNNEWQKKQLSDFIKINPIEKVKKGSILKKVSMADIQPYHRKIENYFISKYSGGSKFRNGDTLMARITPCLENGKTAFVDILDKKEIAYGSTEFIVLRNIQDESINKYVYYFTISPKFKNIAIKSMTGTSGRQRVQTDVLKNLVFFIPKVEEQEKIVSILSSLDDKIELNNQINKNLEQIAQAIFKHWFIDFEFPNENGAPYKSSGGEMVDSEIGQIPKGWEIVKLKKIIRFVKGKKPKIILKEKSYKLSKYLTINVLSGKNYLYAQPKGVILTGKDNILMVMDGASSGKIYFGANGIVASTLAKVEILNNNFPTEYVLYFLKYYENEINNHTTGSAIPHTDKDFVLRLKVILPDAKNMLYGKFKKTIGSIENKIIQNNDENKRLAKIRDSLLPKLMSGEIRVPINNKEGDE